jgi:imidazole glycerol-phosphate synthase subunit HisH
LRMDTVVILDYGMSNLRSVAKALEVVSIGKQRVLVSGSSLDLKRADRVVFPGQGAIGDCMRHLDERGLISALEECVRTKPFLGICLGLQSLMERSEEGGGTAGLGRYPGTVVRFQADLRDPTTGERLKVPHMGWNQIWPTRDHPLWQGIEAGSRFYFVHSYYVRPLQPDLIAATTEYGDVFTSALVKDNVFAVQFHPEKSQRAGLRLLANFLSWDGAQSG